MNKTITWLHDPSEYKYIRRNKTYYCEFERTFYLQNLIKSFEDKQYILCGIEPPTILTDKPRDSVYVQVIYFVKPQDIKNEYKPAEGVLTSKLLGE